MKHVYLSLNNKFKHVLFFTAIIFTFGAVSVQQAVHAASVAADGGITLWVSYDNTDAADGLDIDATVDAGDPPGGFTCGVTNGARTAHGEPDAESACPGGAASCTGREKITGDLQRFAQYIYQSTDGTHYLRRVYVADQGRSWDTADIKWNMNTGGSSRPSGAFWNTEGGLQTGSSERRCIHDVVHHEFGHYFYIVPDRYQRTGGYFRGRMDGGAIFNVDANVGDPNTVMSSNFPHRFVDTGNAEITISYDPPGPDDIDFPPGEVLTPDLLSDADPDNDGPDRAHHGHTHPFAQDEWSKISTEHIDLTGVHTEGDFTGPDMATMPALDVRFIGDDTPPPGTVLLLDRSGSMGVLTDGVPASQFVQEAGLYLYHSSQPTDFVGTHLYNAAVEELFEYEEYDPANTPPLASFRPAQGLTDISLALETGIDAIVAEHGEGDANGAHIFLMSDGRQTTGDDLWDQVTRAQEMGIQIHTMAFGNADIPTMEMIATQTSGTAVEVAEREDAGELKLAMARRFTAIRGFKPIFSFKGPLREIGFVRGREVHEGKFTVPGKSRNLLFYAFMDGGNAALYDIELIDPDGTMITRTADSIAQRGRFNGLRVRKPKAGHWVYRILGAHKRDGVLPRDKSFEFTAYAENRELSASVGLAGDVVVKSGFKLIRAQVSNRYPLTDVEARAYLYLGSSLIGWLPLYDDGKNGHDDYPGDGMYHGIINMNKLEKYPIDRKTQPKLRIDVRFNIGQAARPAPNAHYETGAKYDDIFKDYQKQALNDFTFSTWASAYAGIGKPDIPKPQIRVFLPRKQQLVKPGQSGELAFYVVGARPAKDQLRISLGQGVHAKVSEIKSTRRSLGAVVKANYSVDAKAGHGSRDLKVQFGNVILDSPRLLFVGK
jgi:von Willebrand factor type A domain